MQTAPTTYTLAPATEKMLAHHKGPLPFRKSQDLSVFNKTRVVYKIDGKKTKDPYGVPPPSRVITKGQLHQHHDLIRRFLKYDLGLPTAQREAVFRLITMATHYTHVYPKAAQVAQTLGCSKRTFWRAVAALREQGMITVVNRFLIQEEAQISNLYLLTRLLLAISRYLHDHSVRFQQKWLQPLLALPFRAARQKIQRWPWKLVPGATS